MSDESTKENPHICIFKHSGESILDGEKKTVLDVIKTYVKFFRGETAAKSIHENQLKRIISAEDNNSSEDASSSEKSSSEDKPTSESSIPQLFISRLERMICEDVDLMFEEEASSGSATDGGTTADDKDSHQPQKKNSDTMNQMGFAIEYALKVNGEYVTTMPNRWKEAGGRAFETSKNLFMKMLTAIGNLEIKDFKSGKSISVGDLLSTPLSKTYKSIKSLINKFRGTPININQV